MTDNSPLSRFKRPALLVLVALVVFFAVDRIGDAVLRYGIDRYFGLDQDEAVLLVGHSHVVLGVDKVQLERDLGLPVANYARAGAQLEDRILMARHYAELHPGGVKTILFGVDNHLFTPAGLSTNSYRLFYPHMDDPVVGEFLRQHAADRWELYEHRVSHLARYDDTLLNSAIRGWMGNWNSSVGGHFDPAEFPAEIEAEKATDDFRAITIDPAEVERFEAFLAETEARGWPVMLVFMPTTVQWQSLEPQRAAEADALLRRLADAHANVTFVDLREPWQHRSELFIDKLHLNPEGRRVVTEDLSAQIAPLLRRQAP